MNKLNSLSLFGIFITLANSAWAQTNDIFAVELTVFALLGQLSKLLWALAIVTFFWGLVKFMANSGDTAEHQKGKELIIWGLISFVVLVSVWGIVQLIAGDTFGYFSSPIKYIDKSGRTL
jgi:hypothetical protein